MILDEKTTAQRDALTATATGSITVYVPTVDGSLDFTKLRGAIVKINKFPLVEGAEWTSAVSADATAVTLAAAITTATASTGCTATTDGANKVLISASATGAAGNNIHISCFMPQYTFPSGATLTGGLSPTKGDFIYNTTTNKANLRVAAAWEAVTSA